MTTKTQDEKAAEKAEKASAAAAEKAEKVEADRVAELEAAYDDFDDAAKALLAAGQSRHQLAERAERVFDGLHGNNVAAAHAGEDLPYPGLGC